MEKKSNLFKVIVSVLIALAVVLAAVGIVSHFKKASNETKPDSTGQTELTKEDKESSHADLLDQASTVEDEGNQILYLAKDQIYSFSLTDSNGIILSFSRDGDEWVYDDDNSLELDQSRIDNVLNYISDVRFISVIETEDGSEYGLDQNSPICVVNDASGNATVISLGNVDEETGQIYFAMNYDFTKIYVNSGKLANVIDYGIEELVKL